MSYFWSKYNMCSFLSKSFILSTPVLLYNRTNLMLHRLRHETNNNLTSPFREIERKLLRNQKSYEISLYMLWLKKKFKSKEKSWEKSLSGFLTFVFKKSLYDLSLFSKVESFWRNNISAWPSYCEIARTFTLRQVISLLFLQLSSWGWGFD